VGHFITSELRVAPGSQSGRQSVIRAACGLVDVSVPMESHYPQCTGDLDDSSSTDCSEADESYAWPQNRLIV
jgi:hypothetical protein